MENDAAIGIGVLFSDAPNAWALRCNPVCGESGGCSSF
jgi:hypothetical protein